MRIKTKTSQLWRTFTNGSKRLTSRIRSAEIILMVAAIMLPIEMAALDQAGGRHKVAPILILSTLTLVIGKHNQPSNVL